MLSLIDRLPEGSKTLSLVSDPEHWRAYMDISSDYYVMAGIFNAINLNTTATGNFKKKPKLDPWPVPKLAVELEKKREAARPKSVADLFNKAKRWQNG